MDINLLPWREEIIEYNKKVLMRLMLAALLAGGIFIIVAHHLFFGQVSYAESYTETLEQAKVNLAGTVAAYGNYKRTQKEMNDRFSTLQKLQYKRFDAVRLLNGVARVTPKGIYLNSLARVGDQVTVSGDATSNLLIAQMMQSIDATKNFKTLSLHKVEKKDSKDLSYTQFELTLLLVFPDSVSEAPAKKQE